MKKTLKIVAIISLLSVITVMFSGCKKLDLARENRAHWGNKEATEIVFKGETYKKLSACESFNPDVYVVSEGYVGDKDEPILITMYYDNYRLHITKDKEILSVNYNDFFARKDVFEKYENLIKNRNLDRYGTYMTVKDEKYSALSKIVAFEGETTQTLIKDILSTAVQINPDNYRELNYCCDVYKMDESGLFHSYDFNISYSSDQKAYLIFTDKATLKIADEYNERMLEFVAKYGDSHSDCVVE